MGIGAAIGGIAGGLIQSRSASKAADSQERAAREQLALQERIYDETTERYKPYLTEGNRARGAYSYELGLRDAPPAYQGFQETPGYQFQLEQGQDGINALAGAQGGLVSGRTLQDLSSFNQGLANQEYGSHLNRLAGMADMGMGAAGNQATAGNAFVNQSSNSLGSIGNAQAAGAIGQGNAISGGINNAIGAFQYQNALNPGTAQSGLFDGRGLFAGI